ncbi:MAG: hypothetical protein IAE83_17215 [Anaerolinea sp.]|nr:hypothetical protein [Anaerolinea sp.]
MRRAAWFITVASVINVAGFFIGLFEHLDESTWVAHAQFHLVLSWVWLIGLSLMILVLVWGPFQRRERWSFWLLAAGGFFAHGGFYLSVLLVFEGRPPELVHHALLGVLMLMYLTGLIIGWRALNQAS